MVRYIWTAMGIGVAVVAVVVGLYFVGIYEPLADWLRTVYNSRGIAESIEMKRVGWLEIVTLSLVALGIAWCVIDVSQFAQKLLICLAVGMVIFGLSPTLALYGFLYEPVSSITALILAAVSSLIFAGTERGMRKRVLENVLGPRVSQQTYNSLMNAKSPPDFKGSVREVAVVTCSLINHSALQEKMEPGDLLKMTNLFLRSVSTFFIAKGAYLDESGAAQVRGLFGLLGDSGENHIETACSAALELRSRLRNLNQECETRWFQKIEYGVGITAGPMTVGVYGSQGRFFFSGVGDGTDQSRRLAQGNGRYGSEILVDPATFAAVSEDFAFRPMEMFYDPEEESLVELYELLMPVSQFSDEEKARRDAFWQGVIYFREKDYEKSLEFLSKSRRHGQDDGPLDFFVAEAQARITDKSHDVDEKTREMTEEGHARLISHL